MLLQVEHDLSAKLPSDLVDALVSCYNNIVTHYSVGRHEPSELNGGKFTEACIRIIQYEHNSTYTPLTEEIKNVSEILRGFERLPASDLRDSFRVHIPKALATMYGVRNKRGVAHLKGDINPNYSDATLVTSCANWVMCELFSHYYQCSLDEAQSIVNDLAQKSLTLIHRVGNQKRVLLPDLPYKDQTLALLASEYPAAISEARLIEWVEPKDIPGYKRKVLRPLHEQRLIEYRPAEDCLVLPPGIRYVEERYNDWNDRLN